MREVKITWLFERGPSAQKGNKGSLPRASEKVRDAEERGGAVKEEEKAVGSLQLGQTLIVRQELRQSMVETTKKKKKRQCCKKEWRD